MKSVAIVSPIVAIAMQDLRELQREHLVLDYRLVPQRASEQLRSRTLALNGNPQALVGALLQLSLEALTIHALAEAEPDRPVAEILAQAVQQLRKS